MNLFQNLKILFRLLFEVGCHAQRNSFNRIPKRSSVDYRNDGKTITEIAGSIDIGNSAIAELLKNPDAHRNNNKKKKKKKLARLQKKSQKSKEIFSDSLKTKRGQHSDRTDLICTYRYNKTDSI